MSKTNFLTATPVMLIVGLVLGASFMTAACSSEPDQESATSTQQKLSGRYEPGPAGYRSAWFSDGIGGYEVRLTTDDGESVTGTYEVKGRSPSILSVNVEGKATEYRLNFGKTLGESTLSSLGLSSTKPLQGTSSTSACEPTSDGTSTPESETGAGTANITPKTNSAEGAPLLSGCGVDLLPGMKNVASDASLGEGDGADKQIKRAGGAPEVVARERPACKAGCFRSTCGCVLDSCSDYLSTFRCNQLPRNCKDGCK